MFECKDIWSAIYYFELGTGNRFIRKQDPGRQGVKDPDPVFFSGGSNPESIKLIIFVAIYILFVR